MCEAIISLLQECLESGQKYDRIFLLSGLDYPILSNKEIIEICKKKYDKEFIWGFNVSKGNMKKHLNKIRDYHLFMDYSGSRQVGRWLRFFNRFLNNIVPFKKSCTLFEQEKQMDIYYGATWWGLTYECVKYVYVELQKSNHYKNYFKYSFTPDELLIPTLVLNSRFANAQNHISEIRGLKDVTALHYIDYGHEMKVLTEDDFDKIISSGKMFLRKARTGSSDLLLNHIDELRNN